jgi:hypothetical protein
MKFPRSYSNTLQAYLDENKTAQTDSRIYTNTDVI